MKTKKLKKFTYNGLGFPVTLVNVPTIEVRGEQVPNINYNELQKSVLLHLCHKATPLTGNEVRFIRKFFEMTTTQFGALVARSHAAVLKWEKCGNRYAKIEPSAELCLRLIIFKHLHQAGNAFKQLFEEIDIVQLAKCHKSASTQAYELISIDVEEELLAG